LDRQEGEIGSLEQLARPLHRDDGVGEGRRRGIVATARDRGFLLVNSGEQRGQIVAAFDPGEVGGLERQRARGREGVGGGQRRRSGCGWFAGGRIGRAARQQ